jgi:hypothetical protein
VEISPPSNKQNKNATENQQEVYRRTELTLKMFPLIWEVLLGRSSRQNLQIVLF